DRHHPLTVRLNARSFGEALAQGARELREKRVDVREIDLHARRDLIAADSDLLLHATKLTPVDASVGTGRHHRAAVVAVDLLRHWRSNDNASRIYLPASGAGHDDPPGSVGDGDA